MKPNQNYQERIAAPGTPLYYSCRYLSPDAKQAVIAIHSFDQEVGSIGFQCKEREIAQRKLAWWHDELPKLFNNTSQHPIAKALYQAMQTCQLPKELISERVAGAMLSLEQTHCCTEGDYYNHCAREVGNCLILSAYATGFAEQGTIHAMNHLGIAIETIRHINYLYQYLKIGKLLFPLDKIEKAHLTANDFFAKENLPKIRPFLTQMAEFSRHHLQRAKDKLPEADKKRQRHNLIYGELMKQILRQIEVDDFQVFDQHYQLSPLRYLWHSLTK